MKLLWLKILTTQQFFVILLLKLFKIEFDKGLFTYIIFFSLLNVSSIFQFIF